ncbi:hypothetical protein GA0070609_4427 [Micromonospora echinaurantiaca]|uniref:Uncharacterized protein n=1 Tax=Micromonospora echinaurantiaca TaxID=47857 RepID=A0A1C5JG89_9ACTN|nr:hypothetical protein [Micromonospora echinaurantiaca]SCG69604.1 hypothetical protein GA0070609_4427 [Micromonospora echinaurantiaca]
MNIDNRTCQHCGGPIPPKPAGKRGPAPRYCGKICQGKAKHQRAYVPTPRAATMPSRQKHKPGNVYGSLTLVERIESSASGDPRALFRCECGNVKALQINNVANGITTNCADRANHPDSRRRELLTYDGAHNRVKAQRGSASLYTCRCGNQAEDWAYSHADYDERAMIKGREARKPYSTNPDHYSPMCRPCHKRFDNAHRRVPEGGPSLAHVALFMATRDQVEGVAA